MAGTVHIQEDNLCVNFKKYTVNQINNFAPFFPTPLNTKEKNRNLFDAVLKSPHIKKKKQCRILLPKND